jgi:nucleoid DNA-binding protein
MYFCVMFSMIEHIEYLMSRHDCVAIPGWGAFIANYSAARFDEQLAKMERPRRCIGFNASADHNDGLLAQSLMRLEELEYDEAMRLISDSVMTFRQQLSKGAEVSMGRLGYFKRNEGQHIEFVPYQSDEACDRFYGLADMDIKSVVALEQERAEQEAPATIVPEERNLFSRKVVRIAASVAVLIGLGVVLSTPIIVDRSHSMAGMAPEVTAPKTQQVDVTVQQGVVAQPIEAVESHPAIAAVGNTAGKYYMVIATLRNQQELDAFKSKYESLVPYMKMLNHKGYTCVYVARSDDYKALMGLRSELPERLRDVWIYN